MEGGQEADSFVVAWETLPASCTGNVLFAWIIVFSLDLYETLMKYSYGSTLAFASY